MMAIRNFYLDQSYGTVYEYSDQQVAGGFVLPGLIPITEAQAISYLDKPLTPQEVIEQKLADSHRYLYGTDFYYARFSETGEPVPDDVVIKRKEARDFIREHS